MSTYCTPGTVPHVTETVVNKTDPVPAFVELAEEQPDQKLREKERDYNMVSVFLKKEWSWGVPKWLNQGLRSQKKDSAR